jgi:hypothetical protein
MSLIDYYHESLVAVPVRLGFSGCEKRRLRHRQAAEQFGIRLVQALATNASMRMGFPRGSFDAEP